MTQECSCNNDCFTTKDNLDEKIKLINECEKCSDIQIKKFTPLKDLPNLNKINDNYKRCECNKRPINIVMSHVLKIMIEEGIVDENATLRKNSPVPLSGFYYTTLNPQFIAPKMLILLHPNFNKKVASRLINEVSEVKGVLKGNPQDTTGQLNKNSKIKHFKLLNGCDMQTNVVRTLINEKLIFNKKQSTNHIEVAMTTEEKLIRLHNFLENNNIKKNIAIDGLCGGGALGIYLIKYGFKKVIFNDANPEAIKTLKDNLKVNEISENFEIYNKNFEDLNVQKTDLCVIDAFPKADIDEISKKASKIADNVVII